jgi:hypothetical protein
MIGGDKEQQDQRPGGTFANYTDAELLAELSRLANELGIKMTLTLEPDQPLQNLKVLQETVPSTKTKT